MGGTEPAGYHRLAAQYGQILADLRRRQADRAAARDLTIIDARREPVRRPAPEPPPDFATRTWLR